MWYEYIIECIGWGKSNLGEIKYYTGETSDVERRFDEHVHQYHSQWMKLNKYRPRRLVYVECMPDCYSRDVALLREQQLKHLSKEDKRGFSL